MAAGLFLTFIQPGTIDTDGGIFSAIAFKDMHGGRLYMDTWENKPPAIFYLIEFFYLIIPNPVYALFVMALMALCGTAAILFALAYKYISSLWTALLFIGISVIFIIYSNNIGDGLYTEIYGTLCLVSSLLCLEHFRQHPKNIYLILSALLLGLAPWFKEPFILLCLPLYIFYLYCLKAFKSVMLLSFIALTPSVFFLVLLGLENSIAAFIDAFLYNFKYSSHQESNNIQVKLDDYYKNLIKPILGLSVFLVYIAFKNIENKKTRAESLLFISILIASTLLVFLAPYNLGHYYHASFVVFFVVLAKQYALYKSGQNAVFLPFMLLLVYYVYQLSEYTTFTYQIKPFKADRITERLLQDKDATLFVDYVNAGRYYIYAGKKHHAFVPVALPVHFNDSEHGKQNRTRIWRELSIKPADYLITTYTTAYFSWHLPDSKFYEKNYEKLDSAFPEKDYVLYLWKLKTR